MGSPVCGTLLVASWTVAAWGQALGGQNGCGAVNTGHRTVWLMRFSKTAGWLCDVEEHKRFCCITGWMSHLDAG
jgi:hypothetical protein